MTSSIKKLKDSQVELSIDLNREDLLFYTDEAEKILAKEVEVEGFRLGKTPKEAIRKKVGEQVIRERALNIAVQTSLANALAEKKLDVIDQEDFKIKENSVEKLIFQVKLIVFPEIKLGAYKGLEIKRNPVSVADAEVDSVVQDIVKSRTVLKEVERPAKIGDRAEVDFIIKDGNQIIEGGQSENHPVILGESKFVPGFEEQIVGMKNGDKKNFSLNIPADYYQKTIAGKSLNFEVTLKKVQEMSVPKFDDELAKSLGQFGSKTEIVASITEGLKAEKEAKEKDRVRLAMMQKIASTSEFDAPPFLVQKRLDAMIEALDKDLHEKGMELGPYLAHIKKTQDDLRKEWLSQAELQVKMSLVARAVAKEEKIEVEKKEIEEELQAVLQQYIARGEMNGGSAGPEVLQNINPEELKNRIRDVLLNEKIFEFLEKNNKIISGHSS